MHTSNQIPYYEKFELLVLRRVLSEEEIEAFDV